MNKKLQKRFDRLELDQQKLLQKLSALSEEQLNASPQGKWPISYIAAHLITSERLSLLYMKKKSQGISGLRNSGMVEEVKMWVLKLSQRIPFKFKAPGYLVEHTPTSVPLTDLVQRWTAERGKLRKFLEDIKDEDLYKLVYKHPVAGRLNVLQALDFMIEHFHHHLPQINRLL
ncbi:MAG TPA: DinB family protein [Chryseolinea sp.]